MLAPLNVRPIPEPAGTESCFHLFVIRTSRRDAIRTALMQNEIDCGIHYPVPLHLQPALSHMGHRSGDFPVSEQLADTVLSLPMHPNMSGVEVGRTIEVVSRALANERKTFAHEPRKPVAARANL
jgi:dTDP-4-amino-4,6-dideoxygalactose transaminase